MPPIFASVIRGSRSGVAAVWARATRAPRITSQTGTVIELTLSRAGTNRFAAKLATMCADGRCGEVSDELRAAIPAERSNVRRRIRGLRYVDERLALLERELQASQRPRELIRLEPRMEDV